MSQSLVAKIDWARVARTALANGAGKGSQKVNRRNLTDLCERLASGIPLETAARLQNIQPQTIRAWAEKRPIAWQAIEQARAVGEEACLRKIGQASDWKAADRLLGLINSAYQENSGAATSGGPAIQVVINVPTPQLVAAGERPVIDVIPQRTAQDVVPIPVEPAK